jgi:hypothetical protein
MLHRGKTGDEQGILKIYEGKATCFFHRMTPQKIYFRKSLTKDEKGIPAV